MGTAKNAAGAIGKDEVPGPNPGSSSKIACFHLETGDLLLSYGVFRAAVDRQICYGSMITVRVS